MIQLSKKPWECDTAPCHCLFELRRAAGGEVIAASLDHESVRAAVRLLKVKLEFGLPDSIGAW